MIIKNEKAMQSFATSLNQACGDDALIFLQGDLGAGKTTLVRSLLRANHYHEVVPSPTYTLVESYYLPHKTIHHFDLYRIHAADELFDIGISEYLNEKAICIIEWPEQGAGVLPQADLCCKIDIVDSQQRHIQLVAKSEKGQKIATEFITYDK